MGHVRDLPENRLSVDVKHDFKPRYAVIKEKKNWWMTSKKRRPKVIKVWLATDPDREGEAISWHLAYLLGMSTDEVNRVTFNEITKHGIQEGMPTPAVSIRIWWMPSRPAGF